MSVKEQLRMEIDRLDDRYLGLVYRVIRQFPHSDADEKKREVEQGASG